MSLFQQISFHSSLPRTHSLVSASNWVFDSVSFFPPSRSQAEGGRRGKGWDGVRWGRRGGEKQREENGRHWQGRECHQQPSKSRCSGRSRKNKRFSFFLENSPTVHWQEVGCRHLSPCHDHMLSQGTKIKKRKHSLQEMSRTESVLCKINSRQRKRQTVRQNVYLFVHLACH